MKPDVHSKTLLAITRSKAKMFEYDVPMEFHIQLKGNPEKLFDLTIGIVGELSALYSLDDNQKNQDRLVELRKSMQFAAQFFDAYILSKLNQELDPYMIILASAAYYFCDLSGSSSVLINCISTDNIDLNVKGIDRLLIWLLKGDFLKPIDNHEGYYGDLLTKISLNVHEFFKTGRSAIDVFEYLKPLKAIVYNNGTARELLLTDIVYALINKRIKSSTWMCLPKYSDLSIDMWEPIIKKTTFIKELWPAQILLGEQGVYKGDSAIVQMPTSAGKTKALEVIIWSSFLSGRSKLVVIIAPFRALCNEIYNNLYKHFKGDGVKINVISDVIQKDYSSSDFLNNHQVIVVTPEKFNFILRQDPQLAEHVKLVIFDEGHLFDDDTRGVTYELLLSSLKAKLPDEVQIVLISAVISNTNDINEWLLQGEGATIEGGGLTPTYRTVAFASWKDTLGRLEFIKPEEPEIPEFFVPRVIAQMKLNKKKGESKERYFPVKDVKDKGKEIALYLGLKLVRNGAVALFTGRKDSVTLLCDTIYDKYDRGLDIDPPSRFSDTAELNRLEYLYKRNFGDHEISTRLASIGIFAHHGNTPQGIRLAIEYALQKSLVRFVICTSTLAQGVNMPIRYLIISNVRQGKERIRVRDFHNLIGRAGRSGMHTEGSILFANPEIFDKKEVMGEQWHWDEAIELLNFNKAEPCISSILHLFDPWESDDKKTIIPSEIAEFVETYINNIQELYDFIKEVGEELKDRNFSIKGMLYQLNKRINIVEAIESFLIANIEFNDNDLSQIEIDCENLVNETLASYQANETQKEDLLSIFTLLAKHIISVEPNPIKRMMYSKTLFGLNTNKAIDSWVERNIEALENSRSSEELLTILWEVFLEYVQNTSFRGCDDKDILFNICNGWINGKPYYELYDYLRGIKIGNRNARVEQIVDICESALGFNCALLIGAIVQNIEFIAEKDYKDLIGRLNFLQRQLKYGLPDQNAITIYELGLSDRPLTLELSNLIKGKVISKEHLLIILKLNRKQFGAIVDMYPSYYQMQWKNFIEGSLKKK